MKLSKYEKDLQKLMRQCSRGSHSVQAAAKKANVDLLALWAISVTNKNYSDALDACKERCKVTRRLDAELEKVFAEGMFRLDYDSSGQYLECEH